MSNKTGGYEISKKNITATGSPAFIQILNVVTNSLTRKIDVAIGRIIKAEKIAEKYSANKQVILAFSGGKDSQVIYELAKMSGIKFFPIMRLTTLDYPEVVRFVRENYKDVIIERPSKNIYKLIIERQSLPTQIARFCCQALKDKKSVK